MTTIIELAKEAGLIQYVQVEKTCVSNALERFVALVRAEALEEAAKVCADNALESINGVEQSAMRKCAAAIRGLK